MSAGFALVSPSQARADVLHLISQKPQLTFPDSSHCLLTTKSYNPCIGLADASPQRPLGRLPPAQCGVLFHFY